jgi:glycine/D-amino acid oxidase-like deaminating enzyme
VDTPFWLDEPTSPVETDSQGPVDVAIIGAAGYSGHGNVLGFMCGELVASALQGREDPLLELFAPARLLVSG